MKLVVLKNHLGGQILYRNFDPAKKSPSKLFPNCLFFDQKILDSFRRILRPQNQEKYFVIISPETQQKFCSRIKNFRTIFLSK